MTVVSLLPDTEIVKAARQLLKDCLAGEVDGFVIMKEHESGEVKNLVVGVFSQDERSQDHLYMTLGRLQNWFVDEIYLEEL